jgi:hypothetical protein
MLTDDRRHWMSLCRARTEPAAESQVLLAQRLPASVP